MPYFVRPRNNGRTFELRVKHGRLPKPVYRNFDLQEDAQRAGRDAVAALDRGEMPPWLERSERRALVTISQAIVAYRGIRAVPPSTQLLLDTLINDVGSRPLIDVNYAWAEAWIRAMKLERQLAPRRCSRARRVCINGLHRVRTTASRLWLCRSPQRRLEVGD